MNHAVAAWKASVGSAGSRRKCYSAKCYAPSRRTVMSTDWKDQCKPQTSLLFRDKPTLCLLRYFACNAIVF